MLKTIQLKPWYKNSPLWPIPEDWEIKEMRGITSLITNGFVGKATDHYVEAGGILYIQWYNVQEIGFNFSGIKYVSPEFHRRNKKSKLQKWDLLTIQTGDVGVTAYVPKELEGANCHALIISRYIQEVADSQYYHHFLNSPLGRKFLKIIETGSTMKHLNCGDIELLKLPVPPIFEQAAIANILSTYDISILKVLELIEQHERRKLWLTKKLLTWKQRLLRFKDDWCITKFEKIGFIPEKIPVQNIENEKLLTVKLYAKWVEFNLRDIPNISSTGRPYYKRYNNEILIGRQNIHNGWVGLVTTELHWHICSNAITSFQIKPEISKDFILHLLSAPFFYKKIESYMWWTGQKELSERQFLEIPLSLPSKDEQDEISHILNIEDKEIWILKQKLKKLKQTKKWLMQQLLTGKVRVKPSK